MSPDNLVWAVSVFFAVLAIVSILTTAWEREDV